MAPGTTQPRLATLDLIRGVAILGILAINIAGFSGPMVTATTPNLLAPARPIDEAAFALSFIFFEGKMRALFTLLFGAGLVLFWERTEAAGRDGDVLQMRRLAWLLMFGFLHYVFLWWGDILFLYAACGMIALLMRPLDDRMLLWIALSLYYGWHIWGMVEAAPAIHAETAVRRHLATPTDLDLLAGRLAPVRQWALQELHEATLPYLELVRIKIVDRPFWQIQMITGAWSETLPLMLIGMVLYRQGFFDGRMARWRVRDIALACTFAGFVLTGLFLGWAWSRHFPPVAMDAAIVWGLAMPHVLGGIGYAGLIVLAAPRLARSSFGRRLAAAGQMAFSNYALTSLAMTFTFYGWGLGLYGHIAPASQWLFVIGGWAMMLAWSTPWLARFRRGPLEWAWRSLVEGRPLANRRI